MTRPQGVGNESVVPAAVPVMSTTKRRAVVTATALAAAFTLSGCGAAQLLADRSDDPVTETSTAVTTTRTTTPVAVPNLPTRTPEPVPTQAVTDKVRTDVETVAADALGLWQSQLSREIPADMAEYTGMGCPRPVRTASVCSGEGAPTLYWNRNGLTDLQRRGGGLAVAVLMAHEVGHIVLGAVGQSTDNALEERRADCLAGAYISVSKLDLGLSPDALWKRAMPAWTEGRSDKEVTAIRDSFDLGFTAKGDPLAFCLARA